MRQATKTYIDLVSVSKFSRFMKLIPIHLSAFILAANLLTCLECDYGTINVDSDMIPVKESSSFVTLNIFESSMKAPEVINTLKDTRTMDDKIFQWCYEIGKELDVDPYLIRAIIKVESNDNPDICGNGALGLMQIIPSCHKNTMDNYGYSREDLFDPYKNIRVGATYLSTLVHKYDDISYALVCYNKGEGGAHDYGKRTSQYSEHVLSVYNSIKGGDIL